MKRLLVLLPAALLAFPALAQDVPEGAYEDLWCGIAFGTAAQSAPYTPEDLSAAQAAGDAATEQQQQILAISAMVESFVVGGETLIAEANAAYLGAGFSAEAYDAIRAELEPQVVAQVSGAEDAEFSQEECSARLPPAQ